MTDGKKTLKFHKFYLEISTECLEMKAFIKQNKIKFRNTFYD